MKKLIVIFLVLYGTMVSCHKENDDALTMQVREIAWNSLSTQEKATVITNWQVAPVAETVYNEKSAYAVRFNTTEDALLGPIFVYVDKNAKLVLGQGLRD